MPTSNCIVLAANRIGDLVCPTGPADDIFRVHTALSPIPTLGVKDNVGIGGTENALMRHGASMITDGKMGARIRELRKARKQSQVDVSAALDISRSHLAEIEGGKHPGFATFVEIAHYFSVSLDYLYSGSSAASQDIGGAPIEQDEKTLIEFWRGLSDNEKNMLLNLLVRDKKAQIV
ncbi:helix-turn-helix domain-containing protein [Asaia lannensis]|uniref:Helix-turn-helix domain-containing protein n=1 Tax=Asaia lannensis NBRC 102526 TaxID=1307926 RepID=A0ABT1CLH2_9PROT|nr:helix-turn-helix transcriptional regulator [Asaia lannensis]MCO6161053.1 helix-turn-helix domain-containing protein [Asaia lannensis NBRC 102526]